MRQQDDSTGIRSERAKSVLVGAKERKAPKVFGTEPGTGSYYHRYLRIGGRPGRIGMRTNVAPLSRQTKRDEKTVKDIQTQLDKIRKDLRTLEATE
jgi:hypothetical protein